MKKKRLVMRDRKLRQEFKNRKREDVKKDFFELLKRSARTISDHS
jgi:hypothetical protein